MLKTTTYSFLIAMLLCFTSNSQSLVAGDIAFLGFNTDNPEGFSFITLTNIPGNEEIYFTDAGIVNGTSWLPPSGPGGPEQNWLFTAPPAGIPCGTVVSVVEVVTSSQVYTITGVTGATMVWESGTTGVPEINHGPGDNFTAYQVATPGFPASPASATFIAGIHTNYEAACIDPVSSWTLSACVSATSESILPPGLTNGVNCLSFNVLPMGAEFDNFKYNGTLTGTSTVLRAAINDYTNWVVNNSGSYTITPAGYPVPSVTCVAACTNPDVPTVLATPTTICPGASSTLTWVGNLNDATQWHIYTGSCGVTQLTTTTLNTLVVSPGATTTYYIRGEDGAGCVDESTGLCGSITVTVQDITPPTITCPANQIGIVNGACNFTVPDYTGLAVVADNCTASPTVTQSPVPGTIVGIGTTVITLTVTDASSNSANCNFSVVVSDITPPTITCPGNQNQLVDAACQFILADYTGLVTASDNCPGVTLTQLPAPGSTISGATVVTMTATDGASNSVNCNFNVIGVDATLPTITCPGNQVGSANGSCQFVLPDYTALATAADNCPGVTVTQSPVPGTIVGTGTTVITLTATDVSTNTANCNFNVVVSDNTNPTITCPGNQNETPDAACNFTLPDYTALATSADNCDPSPVLTQSPIPGTVVSANTVITLTATDASSNASNCNFTVILIDVTPPTAVCQNINAYLDGAGNVTITAGDLDGGSTDNCAGLTLSASQTAFTCANLGPNNVTLTATDGNTNSSNCISVVTVIDTISPVVTCPGIQLEVVSPTCDLVLPDYTALGVGTDNCGGVTITQSPVAGTIITQLTTITLTATDGSGNSSSCTFDVVLTSAGGPTAICQNINLYLDGAGNGTIVAADIDGGSSVQCGALTFVASQTAFTCADLGANTVTLTVTSVGGGQIASCDAVVTVIDTISPVATCPGNQIEIAGALCDFVLPDYTGLASATDNCNPAPTVTQSPVAGTLITADQTITMTADDGNGNTSTCTFDVNLDMSACAGVECSNAIALAPMDPCGDTQNVTGSTVGGTPQTEGTCGTSVGTGGASWYTFTGDGSDWTVSTVSGATNYDTKLWIFEGVCGALNCVTGNDDFSGVQSQVTFPTTAGFTYYAIVGGYSSSEGSYDMTISNMETEAPVADLVTLGDINGVCEISILLEPTATDNCSAVTVTHDATLPITSSSTITWTYTDANGNFSTQTQNVVLTDLVLPTASNPVSANFECVGDAVIDITVVTDEADNCTGAITVTHVSDVVSGNGCMDTITRTYNVADGSGNNIDVVQMIYIEDVTAPTASNPLDLTVQCISDVPAPVTGWVTDEADNCSAPTVVFVSDVSDGLSCPETITRTFSVTDICGNSIDVIQLVIVMDIDAPVMDLASLPELTGNCDITPSTATATDNCDGIMNGTPDVSFPITAIGTTTITWSWVDGCGNTASQTQDVTITPIDVSTSMASDGITMIVNNLGQTYQWIDCNTGQAVPGATNHNFTPTYGSDFAVIITENGCSDTSACVNSTVGLSGLDIKTVVLYPNPTSGMFNVQFEGVINNIEVVDMLGRVVEVDANLQEGVIDATQLSPGKYMIRITDERGQILVEEFVIQK